MNTYLFWLAVICISVEDDNRAIIHPSFAMISRVPHVSCANVETLRDKATCQLRPLWQETIAARMTPDGGPNGSELLAVEFRISKKLRKGMLRQDAEKVLCISHRSLPDLVNLCRILYAYRTPALPGEIVIIAYDESGSDSRVTDWTVLKKTANFNWPMFPASANPNSAR